MRPNYENRHIRKQLYSASRHLNNIFMCHSIAVVNTAWNIYLFIELVLRCYITHLVNIVVWQSTLDSGNISLYVNVYVVRY